jgi:uncharacterized C2H2 Zn-finger protein/predicted transcriptional regulator
MEELPKIPFAENLAELLASERSESRRDPDKLCDLISIIAWARRFQKPKEQWAEADWADLFIALQLGLDAITETISDLDAKEQQIFKTVKNAVAEDVTCRYVAEETGIPYKTCYRLLEKMIEKGFLNKDKKQGRNVYSAFKEKEPKEFLINVDISPNSPDKLLEQVLRFVGDFSPSHHPTEGGYTLIDPLSGQKLTVEFNVGKPTVKVEDSAILYPPSTPREKVRSVERSKEKVSNGEIKPEEQISQPMRSDLSQFDIDKLEPLTVLSDFKDEHCVKCGLRDVAWQVTLKDGSLGFLCKKCGAELSKDKVESQRQQQNWILKVEGNKVYAKDGNILFQCPYCGVKPTYFASETELEQHIRAFHTGRINKNVQH